MVAADAVAEAELSETLVPLTRCFGGVEDGVGSLLGVSAWCVAAVTEPDDELDSSADEEVEGLTPVTISPDGV